MAHISKDEEAVHITMGSISTLLGPEKFLLIPIDGVEMELVKEGVKIAEGFLYPGKVKRKEPMSLEKKITIDDIDGIDKEFVVITRNTPVTKREIQKDTMSIPLLIKGNKKELRLKAFIVGVSRLHARANHEIGAFIKDDAITYIDDLYKFVLPIKEHEYLLEQIIRNSIAIIYEAHDIVEDTGA